MWRLHCIRISAFDQEAQFGNGAKLRYYSLEKEMVFTHTYAACMHACRKFSIGELFILE